MTRTPWTLARRSFLLGAGLTALAACSSPAGVSCPTSARVVNRPVVPGTGGPAAKALAAIDVGPRGDGSPPRARFHGPAGATPPQAPPGGEPAGLEECRQALVAGRPVRAVLTTPVRPSPQAR